MPSFRGPRSGAGFRAFLGEFLTYLAYLDEFGHTNPYICRSDPQRYDTPVFGRAGLVLSALSHRPRNSPAAWRRIP